MPHNRGLSVVPLDAFLSAKASVPLGSSVQHLARCSIPSEIRPMNVRVPTSSWGPHVSVRASDVGEMAVVGERGGVRCVRHMAG